MGVEGSEQRIDVSENIACIWQATIMRLLQVFTVCKVLQHWLYKCSFMYLAFK